MEVSFKEVVEVISAIFLGAGVLIAALGYRHQAKTRRAEWLKTLFEKFYENDTYKEIRKRIETGAIEKKVDLSSKVTDIDEKLVDYLNFFEFIAVLKSDSQLSFKDISNMFDYYLKKLKTSPAIMSWINSPEYGFEKLRNLLNKPGEYGA